MTVLSALTSDGWLETKQTDTLVVGTRPQPLWRSGWTLEAKMAGIRCPAVRAQTNFSSPRRCQRRTGIRSAISVRRGSDHAGQRYLTAVGPVGTLTEAAFHVGPAAARSGIYRMIFTNQLVSSAMMQMLFHRGRNRVCTGHTGIDAHIGFAIQE